MPFLGISGTFYPFWKQIQQNKKNTEWYIGEWKD